MTEEHEITLDILLLVLEDQDDVDISNFSIEELKECQRWAGDVTFEASDNLDVKAGPAPLCLRKILPPNHYLQKWRVK